MGVLSTGITGLNAFRSQLTTTAHNVANVNTEGYSRQIVGLSTLPATNTQLGAIGNGVQISEIRRQFDQFLMDRVRTYTSSSQEYEIFLDRASRIDDIIADPDAGISKALQDFFNSAQDVADDPTSTATRDVMLSSAGVLTDRFHSVHEFMEGLRFEINQDIGVLVGEANALAESVADLNAQIQLYINASGGTQPNDLLDRRDKVITDLAELVNITTSQQKDGTVNVFMGNGQGIVIGARSFALSTQINNSEPDRLDITLEGGGGTAGVVTEFLSGGKFGGYLRFREEMLDPTENAIGRLAMGLGTFFNQQHQLGMDLNGDLGQDFFDIPDPTDAADIYGQRMLLSSVGSPVTIKSLNVAEFSTADYELTNASATTWTLFNRQTGQTSTLTQFDDPATAAVNDWVIEFDGIKIDVASNPPAVGDFYIVRPTREAGRAIETLLNDARQIAAASPIGISEGPRVAAPAGPNTGTADISSAVLTSRTGNTLLAGNVTMEFTGAAFTVSPGGLATPSPIAYTPGQPMDITITGLGVFSVTITGTPNVGDRFTLATNSDNLGGDIAVGDNRNALKLAALQTEKTMRNDTSGNPTSNFVSLYSSLIGEVGSSTRQAIIGSNTQERLKEQSVTALDEVSGVNLDEEAANLVHFQQAYQAATQVIRVSNQLFDSLLNSVG